MEITLPLLEELFITQEFCDNYWVNYVFRYITANKGGRVCKTILRICVLINPVKLCYIFLTSPDPPEDTTTALNCQMSASVFL